MADTPGPGTPVSKLFSPEEKERAASDGFAFDFSPKGGGKRKRKQKQRRAGAGRGGAGGQEPAAPDPAAPADAAAAAPAPTAPAPAPAPTAPAPASLLDREDGFLSQNEWRAMDIDGATRRLAVPKFLSEWVEYFYGDIPAHELERVLLLSGTLFFIIGAYWLLRSCKDPIMTHLVGIEYIPKAKMGSLFVVLGAVYVYNTLVDHYPKHQLFYIVGGFYGTLFCLIAAMLAHPTIGMANAEASPTRVLGWLSYFAIESFGSLQVSLFWQFTNANVDLKTAKASYGLIVAGAQVGSILGPTIATGAHSVGMSALYLCGAAAVGCMVLMVRLYVRRFRPAGGAAEHKAPSKGRASALEGLRLMGKYSYVRGIFAVSCLFMVEVTVLDYMMKVLAHREFTERHPDDPQAASRAFTAFMGSFGQMANLISFAFSLTGTSFVIRRLGLRRTLLAFPSLCCGAILVVFLAPKLYVVFFAMMLLKGFSYALNNPVKEILYQPTSAAVKYKCKSWIDGFGARGAKAAGSIITDSFSGSVAALVTFGSLAAGSVSLFLVWVAHWIGGRFEEFVETDFVVGDEVFEETVFGLDDEDEDGDAEAGAGGGGGGDGDGDGDGEGEGDGDGEGEGDGDGEGGGTGEGGAAASPVRHMV